MQEPEQWITVFRSTGMDAEEQAGAMRELLADAGLVAQIRTDEAPGVVSGTAEVCVPAADASRAEALIANRSEPPVTPADPSAELDLESVFFSEGTTGEMQATSVQRILEASGLSAVIVGSSPLPSLPFEVRVAREHAEQARSILAEARAAGPAAADEAERASEETA